MHTLQHQRNVQHLLWRAGFGASPAEIRQLSMQPLDKIIRQLFLESKTADTIEVVGDENLLSEFKKLKREAKQTAGSEEEKKEMLKEALGERRETIGNLNYTWVKRMGEGKGALREKMTLFWHNHFACRSKIASFVEQQNNTIRQHALGKFGDLLMAISKDAAMLQFLNNQQNRKKTPNENFAREVMELFTLGRGHYTEQDIKEAARAFTGWGFTLQGEFVFRPFFHDDGEKTIFGKTGRFKGEDVIKMLLEKPQTATFIATKIYRYFVNERVNQAHVAAMAQRFLSTEYDIADLLEYVFKSEWFYAPDHLGAQIKSPVELLAGMKRTLGVQFDDKAPVLYVQKVLGQVLFFPPNVAGWAGGKTWIDSSSLLTRMQLPQAFFRNETLAVGVKDDGDANEEKIQRKAKFDLKIDWAQWAKTFEKEPSETLPQTLASYLIQVPINAQVLKNISQRNEGKSHEEQVKQTTIALMSLPEYQV
ncbi:MAG: DUF1800 domain-containing protein [Spirosomaceae bacterium]|nr:DUF1800 domain-containing protein [Spirosomataceae bacterium]